MTAADDVTRYRQRVRVAGYLPVPVAGKAPVSQGWQKLTDTNAEQIADWGKHWPDATNTGVLTLRTPALDVDVLDQEAAEAVESLVCERFDDHGSVLVRIGKAPKRLIAFKCVTPFKKIVISLIAPNGDTAQKLEFLCDGQQFVANGIHPDTGTPYRWFGGDLDSVRHDDLPEIDEARARELIEAAADLLCREHNYRRVEKKTKPRANGKDHGSGAEDWGPLVEKIRNGVELHDAIRDLAAKLIASGMSGAASVNFLRSTMNGYTGERDARWRDRYDDVPRAVATAEGKVERLQKRDDTVSLKDFYSYLPTKKYIFAPTGELWSASGVNARLPPVLIGDKFAAPSTIIDQGQRVEQMTWFPGKPMVIEDWLISGGQWINRVGTTVFNLYQSPPVKPGNADNATRWTEHIERIYPDEAAHIVKWLAHRVQRPDQKINHTLVLGGSQGIGKDTLLEPVARAVGAQNFTEVSPVQLLGRFNGFLQSVILRVSEARDLGEVNRYAFYEHTKAFTAAPPDTLRCDRKHLAEYPIANVCGVVITTNNKFNGLYLPADDRRHFVAWSALTKDDFKPDYFPGLWSWYENGGFEDVAAYLRALDLSGFDAKAPPRKTDCFWDIVSASNAPEDAEFADALDGLGNPSVVTVDQVARAAKVADFVDWLRERKNRRQIPHRFESCGYTLVRNPTTSSGLWQINGRRQAVYGKATLSPGVRIAAARELAR
jgi:hypothetical protein